MDTKTILATLDAGLLDAAAAVRKLCEAVDQLGATNVALRQHLTAAIDMTKKLDKMLAPEIMTFGEMTEVVDKMRAIVCAAMSSEGECCGQEELPIPMELTEAGRDECERLKAAEMAKAAFGGEQKDRIL